MKTLNHPGISDINSARLQQPHQLMCANYDPLITPERFSTFFNVDAADLPLDLKSSLWPGYFGAFLRKHEFADVGDDAVPFIPAEAIYEPDWRSGKAVPTRISRADGKPMGIAGIWGTWRSPAGEVVHSFTMHTINADTHPVMRQFHKPDDEKRMVVILNEQNYDPWLQASATESRDFLTQYPAEKLLAVSKASGSLF